ncbi:carboxymuconolactone decarboxylase family protein [Granulicella sp. 5B5]|uniref:carboxymuconolactone decarboxylase family protein n=1 Tax=Granulicella sp. 5B5 TaxID=1617967 RepID=UPI0015F3C3A9|nr:carboxymuconolactone decarboxylase family protein [Granulicella sp. 5B5]QMV19814.1 carboxymuconolactone decarboxylase family protein [Granulicella sp. 5B5]
MARLSYPKLSPKTYEAMLNLGKTLRLDTQLEPVLLEYVKLRASIVNGCHFCIGMHTSDLRHHNEPQTRIEATRDWQSSDAFTPRERAALAWTDRLTKLDGNETSDAEYAAVNEYFQDKDLVDLTHAIAQINAWNRLGVAFAPEWQEPKSHVPAETKTETTTA